MNNEIQMIKESIADEIKSMQIYRTLANDSSNADLKQLFLNLMNDEQRHVHLLQSMYYDKTGEHYTPIVSPVNPNTHAEELIDIQIENEINDLQKYNRAANLASNERFSKLFSQIANDENVHALRLLNLQK